MYEQNQPPSDKGPQLGNSVNFSLDAIEHQAKDGVARQCLTHLYAFKTECRHDQRQITIGQVITECLAAASNERLCDLGLKVVYICGEEPALVIAHASPSLEAIFLGTNWGEGRWIKALSFLGAKSTGTVYRFGDHVSRAHVIPPAYYPQRVHA